MRAWLVSHFVWRVAVAISFPLLCGAQATHLVSGLDVPESNCKLESSAVCELHKNPKDLLEGEQNCRWREGEAIVYQAHYQDGHLEGILKCWTSEGRPTLEADYKKGVLDGKLKTGWEEKLGLWTSERDYRDGKLEGFGISKTYESTGGKERLTGEMIRMYKDGKEHGFMLMVENGKVASYGDCLVMGERQTSEDPCEKISLGLYDDDFKKFKAAKSAKQEKDCGGTRKRHYSGFRIGEKTESLIEVFEQKDCLKQGKSTLFRQDEKTKLVETIFVKDKREGEQVVYFPEGGVSEKIVYKGDLPVEVNTFYQNGKKKSEVEIKSKDRWTLEATFRLYDDLGTLREKGQSKGDLDRASSGSYPGVSDLVLFSKRIGCHLTFDKKGTQIQSDCHDDNGDLDGISTEVRDEDDEKAEKLYKKNVLISEKIFDLNSGKLKRTLEYFPDGSRKSLVESPESK